MSDDESSDREMRKFEREMDFREKGLENTNELLQEAPSLLSELTTEVVLPLLNSLQSNQPAQSRRSEPEFSPTEEGEQLQTPGPSDFDKKDNNG